MLRSNVVNTKFLIYSDKENEMDVVSLNLSRKRKRTKSRNLWNPWAIAHLRPLFDYRFQVEPISTASGENSISGCASPSPTIAPLPQFPASILEEGRRFLVRWKGEDASAGCSPRATRRYFFRQIYSLRRTTFLPLPRMDESDSNFLKDATSFPPPRASRRAESTRAYKISYRGRLAKLERATNNLYSPTVLFFVELAPTFPSSLSLSCPPQHEILNSLFK